MTHSPRVKRDTRQKFKTSRIT
ncbi:hypothetical protein L3X07_02775 [Levilactobacillus brevis]|nr:hypothetical protein [Levilactobacillus brevis]